MTGAICLTMDVPPSTNRYFRIWRNRAVRTHEADAYRNKVLLHARNRGLPLFPLNSRLSVTLKWYRAIRAGDLDNRAKCCLDSLQGVLYVNDSQIIELHMYRYEDPERPRVEVEITRLDEPKVA